MTTTTLIPGSLGAIAARDGQSLAESFLSADLIVLIDTSSSMEERDVPPADMPEFGGKAGAARQRYAVACEELKRAQASAPGRIAVVSFASFAQFCPGGIPPKPMGGTNLHHALEFVQPADGTVKYLVISDGSPTSPDECLTLARSFASTIDTVYVGPKGDSGEDFMRRLAQAGGGAHHAKRLPELAATIAGLLPAGR